MAEPQSPPSYLPESWRVRSVVIGITSTKHGCIVNSYLCYPFPARDTRRHLLQHLPGMKPAPVATR